MNGCLGRAHEELVIDDLPAGEYLLGCSWSMQAGRSSTHTYVAFDVVKEHVDRCTFG